MAHNDAARSFNSKNLSCSGGTYSLSDIIPWNKSIEAKLSNSMSSHPDLGMRISLWSGDITKLNVDAIANAANHELIGGGGVDGAIHRAAGPELHRACLALNGCPTGQAKITPGFRLPAKYIIHCVGPIGEKPKALQSTYYRALELCTQHSLKSIAFPCISTGIYGYPQDAAAKVAVSTVLSYLHSHKEIERVIFCVFLAEDHEVYKEVIPKYLKQFAATEQLTG